MVFTQDWKEITAQSFDVFLDKGWIKPNSHRISRGCLSKIHNYIEEAAGEEINKHTFISAWHREIKPAVDSDNNQSSYSSNPLPNNAGSNGGDHTKTDSITEIIEENAEIIAKASKGVEALNDMFTMLLSRVRNLGDRVSELSSEIALRDARIEDIEKQLLQVMKDNMILANTQREALSCFEIIEELNDKMQKELDDLTSQES